MQVYFLHNAIKKSSQCFFQGLASLWVCRLLNPKATGWLILMSSALPWALFHIGKSPWEPELWLHIVMQLFTFLCFFFPLWLGLFISFVSCIMALDNHSFQAWKSLMVNINWNPTAKFINIYPIIWKGSCCYLGKTIYTMTQNIRTVFINSQVVDDAWAPSCQIGFLQRWNCACQLVLGHRTHHQPPGSRACTCHYQKDPEIVLLGERECW